MNILGGQSKADRYLIVHKRHPPSTVAVSMTRYGCQANLNTRLAHKVEKAAGCGCLGDEICSRYDAITSETVQFWMYERRT